MAPITIGTSTIATSCGLTEERPPMSQNVIAGNLLKGSATNFASEIKAENRLETIMPAKTRTSVESLPRETRELIE